MLRAYVKNERSLSIRDKSVLLWRFESKDIRLDGVLEKIGGLAQVPVPKDAAIRMREDVHVVHIALVWK